jgi:hypothetical protein
MATSAAAVCSNIHISAAPGAIRYDRAAPELFASFYVSKETAHGQAVRRAAAEFDRRQRPGIFPA